MNKRLSKKKIIEAIYNFSFRDDYIFTFDTDGERNKIVRKQAMIYFKDSPRLTNNIINNYYRQFPKKERKLCK